MFLHVHPFTSSKVTEDANFEIPKCETYEYAKVHRQPTQGSTPISEHETDGSIKSSYNCPGDCASVNHFEYRLKGRTINSFGRPYSEQYVGGCIVLDHASGYLHVDNQMGF